MGRADRLVLEGNHEIDPLPHEGPCGCARGILVGLVPIVEADVPALLVTHTSEALAQWCESGRIVVEANVEEPDSRDLRRRLRLCGERRKSEAKSENDREPDQPHRISVEDGWRGV